MTPRFFLPAALIWAFCITPLPAAEPGKLQHLESVDQTPEGLNKSDWQSIRAAYEAGRHAFQPVEGGWQARNPGQQWLTTFDQRGFIAEPQSGGWTWGLELQSYGFGEEQQSISGTPAVKAAGQRLSYQWDAQVVEWFVNDPRGLEHGFTVASRPEHGGSAPLAFLLGTRGSLRPNITADAQGVLFQTASGTTVLNYTGLKVWDADGKVLPSHFEPAGTHGVRLLVDETAARYPITIDPIAQQAYLKANNAGAADQFGRAVAVSGDTVVIGAPSEDSNARSAGAAYVFTRSGGVWTQQAYLKASNTGADDYFGTSVAVSGDTAVIGASGEKSSATGVGGNESDNSLPFAGAAYVFTRSGGVWTQQAYLKASNTGADDYFGLSVAVSGDTAVIGALSEDSSATGVGGNESDNSTSESGAAYVFTRSGSTWTQQAYLKASNTGLFDYFGSSVAVSGDTVVVGAQYEGSNATGVGGNQADNSVNSAGAAYVFTRSGSTWTQQAYLKASNTGADDYFGRSVAVSGDTVVIGAYAEDSNATGVGGNESDDSLPYAGAAYVFTRSAGVWTQQAYLKASNTGETDYFGSSVAVSGDTVVIGANYEGSSATGVDGNQADNSAGASGAAYVFARSGSIWSQQAYLKASNTGESDYFGSSVAVDGGTTVIGAYGEASESGAAYTFAGLGPTAASLTVTNVSPSSGPTAGGTSVTITGTNLTGASSVTFGGVAATNVSVVNATTITCTTPAGSAGSASVLVTTPDGTNAANSLYTYVAPAPSITNVNPASGTTAGGSNVTITGTNFTGATSVTFGGAAAINVSVVNATTITCTTPLGTVGPASVLVTTPGGTNAANTLFTYGAPAPSVTNVSPANGSTLGGTSVTITGMNLSGATSVTFGGATATNVSVVNATTITCTTPAGSAGSASVLVTTPDGTNAANSLYTYVAPAPSITNVNPASGTTAGGSNVTITGTNFIGATSVTFGGAAATNVSVVNATTLTCTTAARSAGTASVLVTTPAGTNAANSLFTYVAPVPTVTNISPATGSTSGGTSVTITGTGLSGATSVTFGGAAATNVSVVNATTITCTTPAGSAGSASVLVTTADGTNGANSLFTYGAPAPTVTNVSPASGSTSGGTSVTITGTNLTGATSVTFGGVAAQSVSVVNATTITCKTPSGSAGSASVLVVTPDGTNAANSLFTYGAPAPTVTNVSPAIGSTAGGTSVTITGTNLTGATGVTFGGAAATSVSVVNATTLTCTTPSGSTGSVSVLVTTPDGTNAANTLFTYAGKPTLTNVSPATGSTAGGTSVTITGMNLTGATSVIFGGAAATNLSVVNATTITCTTPPGSAGSTSVLVTTPGGTNGPNTLFAYVLPVGLPEVLDSPGLTYTLGGNGNWSGQTAITHDGMDAGQSGLIGHSQDTWFETSVTGPGSLSFWWKVSSESGYDYLEFYIDDALQTGPISGNVDWTQKNHSLTAGSHTLRWRYMKDGSETVGADAGWVDEVVWTPDGPAVTSVAPASGSTLGGTSVTITGTNLTGASAVTFGGAAATNVSVVNATTITCTTPTGSVGAASVLVTTPDGTNAANTLYTYLAPAPTVTNVSPAIGSTAGGTSVTITGTSFNGASAVTFGGAAATNLSVVDATTITCSTPTGSAGTSSVLVTTPGGTNAANSLFTYVVPGPLAALEAYLKASNTGPQDLFGHSVAVSGDTAVVGASAEDSNATGVDGDGTNNNASNAGAAYVFTRSAGVWTQQAYLKASNTGAGDGFGSSVAVSGDTVVIGALGENSNATGVNGNQADNSALSAGAAYVFTRTGSTWTQQAYLKASNSGAGDNFGYAVAVSGDTVVIGAQYEDSNAAGVDGDGTNNTAADSGAAYVFTRSAGFWTQQAYLKGSNTEAGDFFGISVAVSGDTAIIGAYAEDSNATGVDGDGTNNSASVAGAAYVFTRTAGVWTQQAYLKASNTEAGDYFGTSVAVSGDTAVVGATGENSNATGVNGDQTNNSASAAGAVYVFTRSGNAWSQQAYLKASNTEAGDNFGYPVAVSGNTALIGAYREDSSATGVNGNQADNSASDSGAAYVFTYSGSTWTQHAYLKASNAGASDLFGRSVAVSGDTAVAGASYEDSNATGVGGNDGDAGPGGDSGAAYTFTGLGPPTASFTVTNVNPATGTTAGGTSVTITGTDFTGASSVTFGGAAATSVIVVDATTITCTTPSGGAGTASILVTTPSGTNAANTLFTYVAPPIVTNVNPFTGPTAGGTSVTITGANFTGVTGVTFGGTAATDVSVVNATTITCTSPSGSIGSASVLVTPIPPGATHAANTLFTYVQPGPLAALDAYLKASNAGKSDLFGYAVAISGDTAIVGAYQEFSDATGVNGNQVDNSALGAGAAYVFIRSAGVWTQQAYLKASNTEAYDNFGYAVAVAGDTVVIGAYAEDSNATGVNGNQADNSAIDSGAAYIFTRSAGVWTQQAYLKARNAEAGDWFGQSVAVSGDTVVIGAKLEDSNATGVNGNYWNNSATYAGAAYVFTRSGSTWTQQAYLKASNTALADYFGYAVAVSGDTAVIGASGESSNATGVGGNQANNSAPSTGAAYVFTRSGNAWSQQAYLKASNSGASDLFGSSVAVSGDTAVIGARGEDSNTTGVDGNQADDSASSAGAAYVFTRSAGLWSQQAYLKASNTEASDVFGESVAVSGDTVVIGAKLESSNTTGVDGNQADNSVSSAGAAYVFTRSGSTWTQQAYLKASNTAAGDYFGVSVAVSGDTAVIGAYGEDSNATGVGGDGTDNSSSVSGSAYMFSGLGPVAAPTVTTVNSSTGPIVGGTSVTITGSNFAGASAVTFGGVAATNVSVVNANTITCTIPAHSAGTVSVLVTTPGGTNAANSLFTYVAPPTVASVSPSSGPTAGGTSVTITGTGFTGAAAVTFGGAAATNVSVVSASTITCTTPSGSAGSASVLVTTPGGTNTANSLFTYLAPAPTVTNVSPASGSTSGGTNVTITGTNFIGATSVTFGGAAATNVSVVNATTLTCTTPARSAGTASVLVTTPGGNNAANSLYTYVAPTLSVTNVSPASGSTAGGTSVTITGTNFTGASAVTFGGAAANNISVVDATTITATTPAGTVGPASVLVTTPGGTNTANALFTYVTPGPLAALEAYLKASNTGAGDYFGWSVAVSGDTAVIGAHGDFSNATGVDGDQADNSAPFAGAAYVFTRSAGVWTQQAYLKASNTGVFDNFGQSVAVSGDTVVVGAYGEASNATGVNGDQANNSASAAGAAYVFTRSGSTWTQQAYLKASNTEAGDYFGRSVAVAGDTVVIGATEEASSATGVDGDQSSNSASASGAAYVFYRSGSTWSQQAYLKASNADANDNFGYSVAVSGDTVVIGSVGEASLATGVDGDGTNNSASSAGAAYVFSRSGSTWTQQAYLKASNTGSSDKFGYSVAVSDDTAVIGAWDEKSNATGVNGNQADNSAGGSGAAYVFTRSAGLWTQQAYLKASNSGGSDQFGWSVAVSGDTAVIGAIGESSDATGLNGNQANNNASTSGAAYVFTRSGSTWTQQTYVKASNTGASDKFGWSVAVSGGTAVIGSIGESSSATGVGGDGTDNSATDSGAAYIASVSGLDTAPPTGGLMTLSPASPFGPAAALTVSFTGWSDVSTPLSYEIYIDDIIIGVKGHTSLRNLTAPTTPGTHTLKGRIYDALDHMTEVTQNFTVNTPQQSFAAAMTAAGLGGIDTDATATPFDDGVPNLLKYAFNMNLAGSDSRTMGEGGGAGLPAITSQPNGASSLFRYEFIRRKNSGLVYTPQKTGDLGNPNSWAPLTDTPTVIPIDATWERVIYEEPYDAAVTPRCFGRVQVTLPP